MSENSRTTKFYSEMEQRVAALEAEIEVLRNALEDALPHIAHHRIAEHVRVILETQP